MRYLVQFVVPLVIVASVVYLLALRRDGARRTVGTESPADDEKRDARVVVVILVLGALAAASAFLLFSGLFG